MNLYHCADRAVLRVRNAAASFLKAYTTNIATAARAAFVDLQGRIVAVADQHYLSENEILLVVRKPFRERLLTHLEKYLRLGDTVIEEEPGWKVYFSSEGRSASGGDIVIRQKKGALLLSHEEKQAVMSEEEFTRFRVLNGLPLQGIDFDRELILNVSEEFVSFDKGCYLGQEIVARVQYRAKPPRKLVVKSETECSAEERAHMTSRVPLDGKVSGFVFVGHI